MELEISRSVLAAIERETAASPALEVCGLLFGQGNRIDAHQPCVNVAERPADSFEIDPAALIAAYRAERSGGRRIAGCYHSHPFGDATPSMHDAGAAEANGWVWLIAARETIQAFRAVKAGQLDGRFDPIFYCHSREGGNS